MSMVNIAALQFKWHLEDYESSTSFRSRVCSIMDGIRSKIGDSSPLLIVLPEDIGTPMLLFGSYDMIKDKKTFAQAARSLIMRKLPHVLFYKLRYGVSLVRALMLSKAKDMEKDYVEIFSFISQKYNAYIAAGSITLPDIASKDNIKYVKGGYVYNKSYLFGPNGRIIGIQKKVHLTGFEGKSGFDLSDGKLDELKVFDTPFGKIGIAICLDAFYDDVCERLYSLGADILLQPSANNEEWAKWQQEDWLNGSYKAAYKEKKFKYVVNPMMNGNIFDLAFEGQSSIISSNDTGCQTNFSLLEPVSGFVNIAKHHNTEEIIIAVVDI